jgi:hypothetical protein
MCNVRRAPRHPRNVRSEAASSFARKRNPAKNRVRSFGEVRPVKKRLPNALPGGIPRLENHPSLTLI